MQLKNKDILVSFGKTALAGGVIFSIGWGMLVLQPQPETPVAEAEADIFGLDFAPQSDQQKFVEALMREGMEEPRAYDANGNKMFFSTTVTEESPREVLERFQRSFVEVGLNENVHLSAPPDGNLELLDWDAMKRDPKKAQEAKAFYEQRQAWGNDYLGGIVPQYVDQNRMFMVGTTTINEANSALDWVEEVQAQIEQAGGGKIDVSEGQKAMRYMEATVERPGKTRINAIWSDENYSAKKIADLGGDISVDPNIPICPGCKRLLQFSGESEKEYANTVIDGGYQTTSQVMSFYTRAFQNRGWELTPTGAILDLAETKSVKRPSNIENIEFRKGNESLTVMSFLGDDGRTSVHVARAPKPVAP